MSKITDITESLHTLVAAALPAYQLIPEAIDIADNSELYMENGYTILIADTDPNQATTKSILQQNRVFGVSLVNQVYTTEHNAEGIKDSKISLMEDGFTIVKDLHLTNDTIEGNAIDCNFLGDDGIDFLEGDRNKFYLLTLIFEIKYRESLS